MDIDKLIQETEKIKLKEDQLWDVVHEYTEIIVIGNGGSNSIASHIAQDYTKVFKDILTEVDVILLLRMVRWVK